MNLFSASLRLRLKLFVITFGCVFATESDAQDGGQIYATYCGACHAPEGQGQPIAGIPPLAGSRWVAGEPDRMIQIVLHGVMGPMEVNGKVYNSMMPAQGLVLSDDQLAAALTHVRSNWGNRETKPVTPEMIAAERERTAQRAAPWEAIELLKQYPLPKEEVLFTKIEATLRESEDAEPVKLSSESLPQNLISLKAAGEPIKNGNVLEFTGEMTITRDDAYTIFLGSTFATRFEIDGKRYLGSEKAGSTRSPKQIDLDLTEGIYSFKLTLKRLRSDDIVFSWKSAESPVMKSLIYGDSAKAWETIELVPSTELYFYRGSIDQGGSARAIAIGSPSKLHFVFDPVAAGPTLLWSGRFIDAGRHWTNRGSGLELPMGRDISVLAKGIAWQTTMPEEWPAYDTDETEMDIRNRLVDYLGYQLESDRLGVTFRYRIGGQEIKDHYRPVDGSKLQRTISHPGDAPLYLKLMEAGEAADPGDSSPYLIDQSTALEMVSRPLKVRWIPAEKSDPKAEPSQAGVVVLEPGAELSILYRRN